MAKLADALDLGSSGAIHGGSSPLSPRLYFPHKQDTLGSSWVFKVAPLDLCRHYRNHGGQTHIIFLTGEGDIDNKEKALQSGGDDYIVKPFDVRELSARIGSMLRRSINIINEAIKIRGVTLDTQNRTLTTPLTVLKLTPKEAMMMEYLMRHRNRPFSAGKLLSAIWPSETDVSVGTVRTPMHNLRQKLASAGQEFFIKSIANSGYVIED